MPNTYNIYLGVGSVEAVDWSQPVAVANGPGPVEVPLTAEPGVRYVLAARAVSEAGVEERNTHVSAVVEVDEAGALLPPPPPRCEDATARLLTDGDTRVEWSCRARPGRAEPDGFDVFTDDGTGTLDLATPAAALDAVGPGQREFALRLTPAAPPLKLAVRGRAGGRVGPLSRIVTLAAPVPPAPANVL